MSIEQGIIQAMIATSALFFYAAFKLDGRHSVYSMFLFLNGLLFMPVTLFVATTLANVRNFDTAVVDVLSYVSLGYFMIFFVGLIYFGIVVYMHDAFTVATGNKDEVNLDINDDTVG